MLSSQSFLASVSVVSSLACEESFIYAVSGGVQTFYAFRIYILGRKTITWASAALVTVPVRALSHPFALQSLIVNSL